MALANSPPPLLSLSPLCPSSPGGHTDPAKLDAAEDAGQSLSLSLTFAPEAEGMGFPAESDESVTAFCLALPQQQQRNEAPPAPLRSGARPRPRAVELTLSLPSGNASTCQNVVEDDAPQLVRTSCLPRVGSESASPASVSTEAFADKPECAPREESEMSPTSLPPGFPDAPKHKKGANGAEGAKGAEEMQTPEQVSSPPRANKRKARLEDLVLFWLHGQMQARAKRSCGSEATPCPVTPTKAGENREAALPPQSCAEEVKVNPCPLQAQHVIHNSSCQSAPKACSAAERSASAAHRASSTASPCSPKTMSAEEPSGADAKSSSEEGDKRVPAKQKTPRMASGGLTGTWVGATSQKRGEELLAAPTSSHNSSLKTTDGGQATSLPPKHETARGQVHTHRLRDTAHPTPPLQAYTPQAQPLQSANSRMIAPGQQFRVCSMQAVHLRRGLILRPLKPKLCARANGQGQMDARTAEEVLRSSEAQQQHADLFLLEQQQQQQEQEQRQQEQEQQVDEDWVGGSVPCCQSGAGEVEAGQSTGKSRSSVEKKRRERISASFAELKEASCVHGDMAHVLSGAAKLIKDQKRRLETMQEKLLVYEVRSGLYKNLGTGTTQTFSKQDEIH